MATSAPLPPPPPAMPSMHSDAPHSPPELKVKRRSSKPIIAWVQRKFAGTGTLKGHGHSVVSKHSPPRTPPSNEFGAHSNSPHRTPSGSRRHKSSHSAKSKNRAGSKERLGSSSGVTSTSGGGASRKHNMRRKLVQNQFTHPPPMSLAAASVHTSGSAYNIAHTNGSLDSPPPSPRSTSFSVSMAAPGSIWSPSNPPEADDDASIRPLPPTSPPSPAPSRSTHYTVSSHTSTYLSDPRTFRSGAASTKPTTLLSVDIGGNGGMAHIAQVAPSVHGGRSSVSGGGSTTAPSSPTLTNRFPNNTRHSHGHSTSTSVSFQVMPTTVGRHPLSEAQVPESDSSSGAAEDESKLSTQAPNLSQPHPRNNPRPSSPPPDNASILTLASSTYAGNPRQMGIGGPSSIASRFPAASLGGSMNRLLWGGDGGEDADASVRALRPRSRRGSWGSESATSTASDRTGWSAAVMLGKKSEIHGEEDDDRGAGVEDLADEEPRLGTSESESSPTSVQLPLLLNVTAPTPQCQTPSSSKLSETGVVSPEAPKEDNAPQVHDKRTSVDNKSQAEEKREGSQDENVLVAEFDKHVIVIAPAAKIAGGESHSSVGKDD
ncbi:hypothetical protein FRC03_009921 [Tulasnella sp. 419]|nr:hypothetical protein FRC03_009921 [Tulasnella sp. 419]